MPTTVVLLGATTSSKWPSLKNEAAENHGQMPEVVVAGVGSHHIMWNDIVLLWFGDGGGTGGREPLWG